MTLQAQLDQVRITWSDRVGQEIAELVMRDNGRLAKQIADHAIKAGAHIPNLALPDHTGKARRLGDLHAIGPVILTFYRGGWCPYCNLELRAYQAILNDIKAAGGNLVAVSPERPDNALSTAEKNALQFLILSDVNGRLADAMGIRFDLSQEIIALYRKFGQNLPIHNGDGRWSLPVPATFVIDQRGRIVLAHVDADYRVRLDPADALRALRDSVQTSRT